MSRRGSPRVPGLAVRRKQRGAAPAPVLPPGMVGISSPAEMGRGAHASATPERAMSAVMCGVAHDGPLQCLIAPFARVIFGPVKYCETASHAECKNSPGPPSVRQGKNSRPLAS